jgi:hypothetical protein
VATNQSIPPFNPDKPSTDLAWVVLLVPTDQLTYWGGKQTYDQAVATYQGAVGQAEAAYAQVLAAYKAIKDQYASASQNLKDAIHGAGHAKETLIGFATALQPGAAIIPAVSAQQQQQLQATSAAYVTALLNIGAMNNALGVALTNLEAASALPMPKEPEDAEINPDTDNIAKAQLAVALAAAKASLEAAWDPFLALRVGLYSHLDEGNAPTPDFVRPRPGRVSPANARVPAP